MTSAKSQEEATCEQTAREFDSSALPLVGTSNFGRCRKPDLETERQTTPSESQEKQRAVRLHRLLIFKSRLSKRAKRLKTANSTHFQHLF